MVHEVGRPIGALHSAIQALVGGADEEMALRRELLAGMDGQLASLRRLLDDLTRFYDEAEGALEIKRRPVALGIARDLIVAHGGRLDVDSTPGQGSCFTLSLPLG